MSYYKELIPEMIKKFKIATKQCMTIIEQEIDGEISDDKLHAVLKAKRMAAEDAKYYSKEIDALEDELTGADKEKEHSSPVKKHSKN